MGSERAGDLLVAIDDARRMRFVDPDRIVLVGSSHGGWAIMDLLALDPPRRLPTNLARLPAGAPADPLAGVAGAILLYPYCGQANRARRAPWTRPIPTLFVLAEDDAIAPSGFCLAVAERLSAAGLPVEVLLFDGVTHGFDQQDRSALSPLVFDPDGDRRGDDGRPGLPRRGRPVTARRNTPRSSAFPVHRRKDQR